MKSRTNAQQELMRQQIIEEERNYSQNSKPLPSSIKVTKASPRISNSLQTNDKITCFNKSVINKVELSSKPFISLTKPQILDSHINKRQRSSSYSVTSDNRQTKLESFSPSAKSPMDLAFSNLGNDDVLDWSQIEPSIITTSEEISQDLLEQIRRGQHETIPESYMETGTEENDSLQDDQSVSSSMKPSTSCPANMAHPYNFTPGQPVLINQQHQKAAQKPMPTVTPSTAGIVEDQKLQWMRDRNKKDCHNRIERKRRDYINNQIQELGQLLPEKLFLSTESKRNKGGILKNSVLYIQQLQQVVSCLQHLQKEAQISENTISLFYKQNQYLESLLIQNGVHFEQATNEKTTLQEWFDVHQTNSQLLQSVNAIQSSWSAEHGPNDKISSYAPSYDEVAVKNEDISAENVLNSTPIGRVQSSNSGAGGSSSGTQSVTTYNSPLNTNTTINTINQNNTSNIRARTTPISNVNIITVNSPHQRNSQSYCSSQPFSKTGIRLYEPSSKSCMTDSPVLSSILIGSNINNTSTTNKLAQDHHQPATNRQSFFTGLSNSVPDDSRTSYLPQTINTDTTSGERYYLIPLSKTKGLQLVTNDFKNSRGLPSNDGPILSRIHSGASDSSLPRVAVLNYSINQDEEVQNFIEISPNQNENEDSLMGEFEFDDIPME